MSVDAPDEDMTLNVIVINGVPPTKSIPSAKINSAQLNVNSRELNRLTTGDEVPIVKTEEETYSSFVESQLRLKSNPLMSVKLELAYTVAVKVEPHVNVVGEVITCRWSESSTSTSKTAVALHVGSPGSTTVYCTKALPGVTPVTVSMGAFSTESMDTDPLSGVVLQIPEPAG